MKRQARALAIAAVVVGVALVVVALVCAIVSIWTGDDRWGYTAFMLCLAGIMSAGSGWVAYP